MLTAVYYGLAIQPKQTLAVYFRVSAGIYNAQNVHKCLHASGCYYE